MEQKDRALPKSGVPRQEAALSLPSHLGSVVAIQDALWAAMWISSTGIPWSAGRQWGILLKKAFPSPPPFLRSIFTIISVSSCSPHTMGMILRARHKCQWMTCHCDCQATGSSLSAWTGSRKYISSFQNYILFKPKRPGKEGILPQKQPEEFSVSNDQLN